MIYDFTGSTVQQNEYNIHDFDSFAEYLDIAIYEDSHILQNKILYHKIHYFPVHIRYPRVYSYQCCRKWRYATKT